MKPAPWHAPKFRRVAPGVEVCDVYLDHYIAAALHALWCRLRRKS